MWMSLGLEKIEKKVKIEDEDTQDRELKAPQERRAMQFLSLRERFGGDSWCLPQRMESLLETMKKIEANMWRKKSGVRLDTSKHCWEIVQVGQLMSLEELYEVSVVEQYVELRLKKIVSENLPRFQVFGQLPNNMQARVQRVRELLENRVRDAHHAYLQANDLWDFQAFSNRYKVYHPQFDIQTIPDIEGIQLVPALFSENLKISLKDTLTHMHEYFAKRNVTSAFQHCILTYLHKSSKQDHDNNLSLLIKALPDALRIPNKNKELSRHKWIIQINPQFTPEQAEVLLNNLIK